LAQTVEGKQGEVERRHAAAARVVSLMFMLTLALAALALFLAPRFRVEVDPVTANSLLFVILFLALGAIVYRRTKFNAMRLQDVASLRGVGGLLDTLHGTTVLVALIGGSISVLGFIFALLTRNGANMLYPGVIAAAVLLYAYPRRAAWGAVVRALTDGDADPVRAAKGKLA
jgi:predicted ABC-type exoprotein transport system permease subunit